MIKEQWKYIKGFEGLYKISSLGAVLSLATSNGKIIKRRWAIPKKPISRNQEKRNRLYIKLQNGFGKRTRRSLGVLVMEHFGEAKQNKAEQIRYKDKDIYNNKIDNLYWGKQPPWD